MRWGSFPTQGHLLEMIYTGFQSVQSTFQFRTTWQAYSPHKRFSVSAKDSNMKNITVLGVDSRIALMA